jgi:hypothetical protein
MIWNFYGKNASCGAEWVANSVRPVGIPASWRIFVNNAGLFVVDPHYANYAPAAALKFDTLTAAKMYCEKMEEDACQELAEQEASKEVKEKDVTVELTATDDLQRYMQNTAKLMDIIKEKDKEIIRLNTLLHKIYAQDCTLSMRDGCVFVTFTDETVSG